MTTKSIDIVVDSKQADKALRRTTKNAKDLGREFDKTSESGFKLSRVAGGISAALAVERVRTYADSFINLNNRLKAATTTALQFSKAQSSVFDIAQEAGVAIEGVADAFSRIAQSTESFGISQERVLDVTKKLTLAIKAGGATAAETSSVLVQLGQGLGTNALQGDELKSILESSIPVSKALAKEFGVTTGELKKLGAEGKLTAERVVKAIENIDEKSINFQRDSTAGFTQLNNALIIYFGNLNEALGVTDGLNATMSGLANNLDSVALSVGVIAAVFAGRYAISVGAAVASQIALTASSLKATATVDRMGMITARTTVLMNAQALAARKASAALALIGGPIGVAVIAAAALIYFASSAESSKEKSERLSSEVKKLTESFLDLTDAQRKVQIVNLGNEIQDISTKLISANEKLNQFKALSDSPIKTEGVRRYSSEVALLNSQLDQATQKQQALFDSGISKKELKEVSPAKKVAAPETSGINIEQTRAALKAETQAIIDEADIRRAFRDGEINQRQLDEEIGLQRIYYDYERRRIAIDENEKLTAIQKAQLKLELAEQEVAAEELLQANLTSAAEKGAKDRERVSMLEQNARIDNLQQGASAALNLISAFGKKSFQAQKNLAIADGIVNIASGVTKALNNPYPANLALAAQVAAQGAALIGTIKSTNIGGAGSAPSSGSISAPQAAIPNFDSGQPNSFEISGVSKVLDSINPDTLYSGDVVQKLFESFEQYERRGG